MKKLLAFLLIQCDVGLFFGIELLNFRTAVWCSADWANQAKRLKENKSRLLINQYNNLCNAGISYAMIFRVLVAGYWWVSKPRLARNSSISRNMYNKQNNYK